MNLDHVSMMRRALLALTALFAILPAGLAVGADCTAGNPNLNMVESTPTSAFTINGNGTVTHNLTGLMWKQCVQGLSGAGCTTGTPTTLTWSAALAAAAADTTAGHNDWRLPNRKELASIIEFCGWGPAINRTVFPATPFDFYYLSSTSYVPDPSRAAGFTFLDGFSVLLAKAIFPQYVRLVRNGQASDAFDAQATGVVTVTKGGTGGGTVTSNSAGIDCGSDCTEIYAAGTPVTLTASPGAGSVFVGWLGPCKGTGQCSLSVEGLSSVSATFAPNTLVPRIDIDANNAYNPLTDGMLMVRRMFGLTGAGLTTGVLGAAATRTDPTAIAQYIDNIKPLLDVDGNSLADPYTDGVLLIRYLFGLRNDALVDNATGPMATRTTAQIQTHIQSLMLP